MKKFLMGVFLSGVVFALSAVSVMAANPFVASDDGVQSYTDKQQSSAFSIQEKEQLPNVKTVDGPLNCFIDGVCIATWCPCYSEPEPNELK